MDVEKWVKDAIETRKSAYVPYSHFQVGACLVTKNGKEYLGCNIENASYGLTNCAERTAIFKAVSEGERDFQYLVVAGDTDEPIVPCGACRQVISEFCPSDMPVLLVNTKGDRRKTTVGELLPGAFSKSDMK
ncbi:cytidine deaminase [Heyndrickxia acidiproducens]|uniref:cytidine deaminase n=1 Tax=Heyndrickxia acidiproducens TaxID=1121084 RepID=UPI00035DD809|nr:cytidine deaminase [Heyndrickxia acidiproducens]